MPALRLFPRKIPLNDPVEIFDKLFAANVMLSETKENTVLSAIS